MAPLLSHLLIPPTTQSILWAPIRDVISKSPYPVSDFLVESWVGSHVHMGMPCHERPSQTDLHLPCLLSFSQEITHGTFPHPSIAWPLLSSFYNAFSPSMTGKKCLYVLAFQLIFSVKASLTSQDNINTIPLLVYITSIKFVNYTLVNYSCSCLSTGL